MSCKKCTNDGLMNVNWSNSICRSCETNLSASGLSGMGNGGSGKPVELIRSELVSLQHLITWYID